MRRDGLMVDFPDAETERAVLGQAQPFGSGIVGSGTPDEC